MLVLSRKKDQQLVIQLGHQTVVVRVLEVTRGRVRIGVAADPSVAVHREEVARRIWQEVAQHPSPVPVGQDGKG